MQKPSANFAVCMWSFDQPFLFKVYWLYIQFYPGKWFGFGFSFVFIFFFSKWIQVSNFSLWFALFQIYTHTVSILKVFAWSCGLCYFLFFLIYMFTANDL